MKLKILLLSIILSISALQSNAQNADFKISDSITCLNQELNIENLSSSNLPLNFHWDFGNQDSSNDSIPNYTYTTPGNYTITLIAGNALGDDTATLDITVHTLPQVNFSADTTAGCQSLEVSYIIDTVHGNSPNIIERTWNFGDGSPTSTGSLTSLNALKQYNSPGVYSPSLSITDGNGCIAFVKKTNLLRVYSPPSAAFSLVQTDICDTTDNIILVNNSTFGDASDTVFYNWDFGDGAVSTLYEPTHTYSNFGLYTVSLEATSQKYQCSGTSNKNTRVWNTKAGGIISQEGDIKLTDSIACPNLKLNYNDTSVDANNSYRWIFGDNSSSGNKNPTHSYPEPGIKTVSLIANFGNVCADTATWQIIVDTIYAGLSISPDNNCSARTHIQVNDLSEYAQHYFYEYEPDSFSNDSTIAEPNYTYIVPTNTDAYYQHTNQSFSVKQIVRSVNRCTDTASAGFIVKRPTALFEVDSTQGCLPLKVHFRNLSISNEPDSAWIWRFGEGTETFSYTDTISFEYNTPGIYNASLVYLNNDNCRDTSYNISIQVGDAVIPNFSVSPATACANTDVALSYTGTLADSIDFFQYHIAGKVVEMLPDSSTVSFKNKIAAGTHNVSITTNYNGCIHKLTKNNAFTSNGPSISFTDSVNCQAANTQVVHFKGNISAHDNFQWNFGDNNFRTDILNPNNLYSAEGDYNVTLWASYGACEDSVTKTIYARDVNAQIIGDTAACAGTAVSFNGAGSYSYPVGYCKPKYFWDFNDEKQNTRTDNDTVFHVYNNRGTFNVSLAAEYDNGCTDTAEHEIQILQPIAQFSVSQDTVCAPDSVQFTDMSVPEPNHPIVNWQWQVHNDSSALVKTQSDTFYFTYNDDQAHQIELQVYDDIGCTDTSKTQVFSGKPNAAFTTPNQEVCAGTTIGFSYNYANADSAIWNMGDGNISNSLNRPFTYTYDTGGYFSPSLILFKYLCTDTATKPEQYITVQKADASFKIQPNDTAFCYPANISFLLNTLNQDKDSARWYFGDTNSIQNTSNSTLNLTSHQYKQKGTYRIMHNIYTTFGCTNSYIDTLHVLGPIGDITLLNDTFCLGGAVSFDISDSANVVDFAWLINEDTIQSNEAFESVISNENDSITLILYGENGCIAPSVSVTPEYYQITAYFVPPDTSTCQAAELTFTNQSEGFTRSEWDFSDGSTSFNNNPSHIFDEPGDYQINLTVYNAQNCSASYYDYLSIKQLPGIMLESSFNAICEGSPITITASAGDSIIWQVDGNVVSGNYSASIDLTPTTTTSVSALAFDKLTGCSSSDTLEINYQPRYNMSVEQEIFDSIANFDNIYIGEWLRLRAKQYDYVNYTWSPMDSSISCFFCPSPVVNPLQTTTYTLTTIDTNGCFTFTIPIEVTVDQKYSVSLPSSVIPNSNKYSHAKIRGWGIKHIIEYSVYNRHGNRVYHAVDYPYDNASVSGWDGKKDDKLLETGTYRYVIRVLTYDGNEISKTGIINLIK